MAEPGVGSYAAVAVPAMPTLRLPRTVLPTSNRARLTIDPDKKSFAGHIEIAAQVSEPTHFFWLHAEGLKIISASATLEGADGTKNIALRVTATDAGYVGFASTEALPVGAVSLSIHYRGSLDEADSAGAFRQKEDGRWYVFTQFEATYARRVFPCFDEPDNKVPWQLTLEVPAGMSAISNTPAATTKTGAGGSKVVVFAKTKPLPSYLLAFAVGPFDIVDAGKTRSGTPMRVIVPKGRGADAGYVVETTGRILALLEDYFGTPYPYKKLDSIAIPLTVSFGAMENPGLITYRLGLLLAREQDRSMNYKRRYASFAAHELAHQWFGNLVTMRYWDDVWLNEAFASWMGDKITHQLEPSWDGHLRVVQRKSNVLHEDRLASARKIRQPIKDANDIENAFDSITYEKGASVIEMFESWLGPEKFRSGVRAYLAQRAWSNATADDFLEALGGAADSKVKSAFATFIDQAGAPLVRFKLECKRGQTPKLLLHQQRYLPIGSAAASARTWKLPVCVRYPTGKTMERACTLLTKETGELALERARSCPSWLVPNAGGIGYYRSELEPKLLSKLLGPGMKRLSRTERVGVVGDVAALVDAGRVDYGVALSLASRLAKSKDRHLVAEALEIATSVRPVVPDALRPNYARFIRKLFGKRAHKLGWSLPKNASEDMRLLRNSLVDVVTDAGDDTALAAKARPLALAWLDDHSALDPDLRELVLYTAALHGDRALWERFHEAAKTAKDRTDRVRLLRAMASFRAPAQIAAGLELLITDEFDPRETSGLLFSRMRSPNGRKQTYEFITKNYAAITKRLPKSYGAYLVLAGTRRCDLALRAQLEAFFGPRADSIPGGPRTHAQAMEELDTCIARRKAQTPSVTKFLKRY